MNRKDRAINLGLKIKSLEGNFSVAKSVILDLEKEITEAVIDENDRENLLILYKKVIQDLKSQVSPSVLVRNKLSQLLEDLSSDIKKANKYSELIKLEGRLTQLTEDLESEEFKKEHRAPLRNRLRKLKETYNKKVGHTLQINYDRLSREINSKCSQKNPFHVSIAIKELNSKVQKTPLFNKDRQNLQAILDTKWQESSRDIKTLKEKDES